MKILFVCEFFPMDKKLKFTGGVESYNYYLAQELSKKNIVTILCRKTSNIAPKFNNSNLKVIPIGPLSNKVDTNFVTIPGRILFTVNAIKIGLKQEFDIVQGNNFVVYSIAFLVGLIKRKPRIIWYADVFLGVWIKHTGLMSGLVGEIVERVILKLPWSHFIALSKSTEKKLIKAGVSKGKITTILAGVDQEFFTDVKVKKNHTFTICCISRLVAYKRIDVLINAISILKSKQIVFKLIIIGQGIEKDRLVNLTRALDLQNNVIFQSNLTRRKLAALVKSSHLFVLPSEAEGFGLVVIEAAACGIPYIVTDIPVLREVTRNGLGGLFFSKGNDKDLASKIEMFINRPEKLKKLEKSANKLAKYYSWAEISIKFQEIYGRNIKKTA